VGENWNILEDDGASNGKYVTVKPGVESLEAADTDEGALISLPFTLDSTGTWYIYGRLNCPGYDDDSFWINVHNNTYEMFNSLVTSGWQWVSLGEYTLRKGDHTLNIAYREDGAKLDKICITTGSTPPTGMGEEALNLCDETKLDKLPETSVKYELSKNYPNPFNPSTNIEYDLPAFEKVNLSVYNVKGELVKVLVDNHQSAGKYNKIFESENLPSGIYFYKLMTKHFSESRSMLLLK
jgi:hypothetical protein